MSADQRVDVELARSAQLVARARRQLAVEALQKATLRLRGVLAARYTLALAVVATAAAGLAATPLFLVLTALTATALVQNIRTVGPRCRADLAHRELDYHQAHHEWDTAHHRMLDIEARHEETL